MRYLSELPYTREDYERGLREQAATRRARVSPRLVLDVAVVAACIALAIVFGAFELWWGAVLLSVVAVGCLLDFVLIAGPKHHRWRVLTTELGIREP
ncbi:hypothetical protein LWP59_01755 [Amycolatopsis acidiphila]|uniref:Uncharacterized protein n=1 Tax=Amycolatopsis acidiphila TaxID=715473 RepID=A0A558AN45_9PSEU|nr:hypothetical protein [Amycolatopsis acidiphila]TVT25686.1 hypothetical protein FNH06_02495 [Amycolatopsis acidiphila]UIJ60443.1 hypothetical protein LWP59_01755 [Amycolatopsis acidiphila]GHG82864.1 hypothetical protein GCM10017788_53740 [Amycolatopsis acidiphila]